MIVFSCDFWTGCEELVFLPKLEGEGKKKNSDLHFQSTSSSQLKLFYYEYLTIFCWVKLHEIRYHLSLKDLLSKQMNTAMKLNLILPKESFTILDVDSKTKRKLSWTPAIQRISLTCETSILHPKMEATQLGFRKDIHGLPWWYTA